MVELRCDHDGSAGILRLHARKTLQLSQNGEFGRHARGWRRYHSPIVGGQIDDAARDHRAASRRATERGRVVPRSVVDRV